VLVVVYSTPHTAATSQRERREREKREREEREREEYSIQEIEESAIQQALVRARQLLDDHDHDCAPSSSEFRSEL